MKYVELLWALDMLSKYYPKYQSHELFLLAEDVWKWLNNELPADSTKLIYLKSIFASPSEAFKKIWQEIQLLAGPYLHLN